MTSEAKLGDVLRRHNEIIHPGDRTSGTAVFVGLEHIEANTGRRIGAETLDLAALTGRKPTFRAGHIVYGYLRPYLNKVWIAEFDGCSSVDQFAFEVNADRASTAYIAAFMRSETFLQRAARATTTGQLPRISIEEIERVTLPLPPVAEQERIAARLGAALALVDKARRASEERVAAAEALPAAYLREAFEGEHVAEWEVSELRAITTKIGSGITPRGGQSSYVEQGIPLIRSQNVHMQRFEYEGLAYISPEQDEEMKLSRVVPGDVLLNITGASIGRVCVVPRQTCPANVNQHVSIIRLQKEHAVPAFVCAYLASPSFQQRIWDNQAGATRQALTKEMIEHFCVPVPPVEEQQRVVEQLSDRLAGAATVLTQCRDELAAIEALPAALLREAFGDAE